MVGFCSVVCVCFVCVVCVCGVCVWGIWQVDTLHRATHLTGGYEELTASSLFTSHLDVSTGSSSSSSSSSSP